MVVSFDFVFEKNPSGTFYAGQTVRGTIKLKLDKPKEVKGIILHITGFAKTLWFEDDFGESETYGGHQDYISQRIHILKPEKTPKVTLAAGVHRYSFDFKLPENCTSTLQTANAKVNYTLKVSIVRPWKVNQNFTKGFTVLNVLDLNEEGDILKQTITARVEKTYGLRSTGPRMPFTMQATLAQKGFVPGQSIPVNLIINNTSPVDVKEINISLYMLVLCLHDGARAKTILNHVLVKKLKAEGVLRYCNKIFDYALEVPATPPTDVSSSRIIQITYEVHIEAVIKGMYANAVLTLPVTIGSVPFETCVEELELEGAYCVFNNLSIDAPPSYEEAMHIPHADLRSEEEQDYGDKEFAPRYPVFRLDDNKR